MISKIARRESRPATQAGLGRLEWLILAAFFTCMILLAVPTVRREMMNVRERIAATDVQTLSNATDLYLREGEGVRNPPGRCIALGPGPEPSGLTGDARIVSLSEWLIDTKRPGKQAGYLTAIPVDPWGNAYVVRYTPTRTGIVCWVLSAGPDGILQTGPYADSPQEDDLAVRLR